MQQAPTTPFAAKNGCISFCREMRSPSAIQILAWQPQRPGITMLWRVSTGLFCDVLNDIEMHTDANESLKKSQPWPRQRLTPFLSTHRLRPCTKVIHPWRTCCPSREMPSEMAEYVNLSVDRISLGKAANLCSQAELFSGPIAKTYCKACPSKKEKDF